MQAFQNIINYIYRYPKAALLKYQRFGGYASYRQMLRGRALMEKAALRLPPTLSEAEGAPVHFLTGKKYLYQTLFCIASLKKHTRTKLKFILVDDGTFDGPLIRRIGQQLPGATVITKETIEENLQAKLPAHLYPNLHRKRKEYPHIKKLTDIHTLGGPGWKLVLDADMLFWAEPVTMLKWLKDARKPIYMTDCQDSYGYPPGLMQQICGAKIPEKLNVGIIGLNSADIDWAKLDEWTGRLEAAEGASYYLEQALTAMLTGGMAAEVLPANEYIVNPADEIINTRSGVLHHYVDLSKQGYFNKAWRMI